MADGHGSAVLFTGSAVSSGGGAGGTGSGGGTGGGSTSGSGGTTAPPPPPPPPVGTTGTSNVPPSIDDSGASDVSVAMMTYLNQLPPGVAAVLKPTGIYRVDQALKLQNRRNFAINGQGGSIRAHGTGFDENYSVLYFVSFGGGNAGVTIHNLDLRGSSPTPGQFHSGQEGQHGILIDGGNGFEIYAVTGSAFWGDFIEVNSGASNIRAHGCTCSTTGRNGISVITGSHVEFDHNVLQRMGYMPFDIEPNTINQPSSFLDIHDNETHEWTNAFFAIDGSGTGADLHDIFVRNNNSIGKSIATVITGPGRKRNIGFTGNAGAGSAALTAQHVDGLVVQHNNGLGSVGLIDCPGAVTTPNP